MDRDRVVDDRGDAGVLQLLLEPVAAAGFRQPEAGAVGRGGAVAAADRLGAAGGNAHHELVPAVALGARFRQGDRLGGSEPLAVGGGDGAAALHPALQVRQLHVEHRRLDGIEA